MRPPIGWIWLRAAAHQAFAAPLGEDFVDLRFGLRDRLGGSLLAAGGARHNVRDDRKSENFTNGSVCRAWPAEVDGPLVGGLQHSEFVRRLRSVGIVVEPTPLRLKLRGKIRKGREVVELALVGGFAVVRNKVKDEFLRRVGILRIRRNLVVENSVAVGPRPLGSGRPLQRGAE